ncbi:uracil-DNA glycosylase family protein [Pseudomonas solani]|uniref:uracil-DNA glycosylase family protein n=1 Tax=Pseudomonas solani TaxID=2731552 RepID=UPI003D6A3415
MPARYESHCIGCPYNNAAHLPVSSQYNRSAPLSIEDNGASVLLIFQAPGVDEWAKGRPVASTNPSSAGVRLATAFRIAGRTRQDYNITNTVQCFPGKEPQVGTTRPRDNAPTAAVRRHCSEWLRQDIQAQSYKRIVVFGAHARRAVRNLGFGDDPRFRFIRRHFE